MDQPVLEAVDVTLRRDGQKILDGVSWQAHAQEHWAVLGPNGAGKTTLISMLSGRLHPSAGRITVLGETLGKVDVTELRSRIGVTSAALATLIPPTEKVADLVLTGAYGTSVRWRELYEDVDFERAHDLLGAFGVAELAERDFGTLSEGEKQRVLLARSLMADPEALLLDEPTSGLDLGGREELMSALTELSAYPLAPLMILVTHHLEQIPVGFTHALLLKAGKVFAAGPISEVLTDGMLTEVFETPLRVGTADGRWWARAAIG